MGEAHEPHHPIVCKEKTLKLYEDNSMECNHLKVPGNDKRTNKAIIHSIACLIIEEASKL